MASIKGVEFRGVKSFSGLDGYGMEASIYLDGKKAGHYFDEGCGGEAHIDIENVTFEKALNARAEAFFKEYPDKFKSLKLFFCILSEFTDTEKTYRKYTKKGYKILVAQNCLIESDVSSSVVFSTSKNLSDADMNKLSAKIPNAHIYKSLDDFIIA